MATREQPNRAWSNLALPYLPSQQSQITNTLHSFTLLRPLNSIYADIHDRPPITSPSLALRSVDVVVAFLGIRRRRRWNAAFRETMRSSSSSDRNRINIAASAQKVDVDNRISLRFYYRIADNILRQVLLFTFVLFQWHGNEEPYM